MDISEEVIKLSSGKSAILLTVPSDEDITDKNITAVRQKLNIPSEPEALLMISGGTDPNTTGIFRFEFIRPLYKFIHDFLYKHRKARINNLFISGIADAAAFLKAVIIDRDTSSDITTTIRQSTAIKGQDSEVVLISIVGSEKAKNLSNCKDDIGPEQSYFVAAKDGPENMIWMMHRLGKNFFRAQTPVVAILAHGDTHSMQEILLAVQAGWPIIILVGSGGKANQIARHWKRRHSLRRKLFPITDPILAAIIDQGKIHLFPLKGSSANLKKLILRQCQIWRYQHSNNDALKGIWNLFACFDNNAKKQQKRYRRNQIWLLLLGIISTTLIIIQKSWLTSPFSQSTTFHFFNVEILINYLSLLHGLIILFPILTSILFGVASHFNAGNKWVMLRGNAEMIKAEIYRYRSQAGIYREERVDERTREERLAAIINDQIIDQLLDTDLMNIATPAYQGEMPPEIECSKEIDDGLSTLSLQQYIHIRLDDQFQFFQQKTQKLEKTARKIRIGMYLIGGVGTFLAAIGFELVVTLTTTIFAALTTYLEYTQTESTLKKYRITAMLLEKVANSWQSLKPEERDSLEQKDLLVASTEEALREEGAGWMSMQRDAVSQALRIDKNEKKPTETGTLPPSA